MTARAALAALCALAVACSGDSVSGPSQSTAELTQVLDEMVPPSVALATSTMSGLPMVSFGPLAAGSCSYAADSRSFVCPTVTGHGLTIDRAFTLLDASGVPQSQYDAHTTDGVRSVSSAVGTMGPDSMQIAMNDHSDMTLTGLLSGRHVLNGVATTDMSGKGGFMMNGSYSFTAHMVTTTQDLVLPASAGDYPKSGTVIMDMSSEMPGMPADTTRMQLTFNGTNRVDVATTMGGYTSHCTIDLTARVPFCMSM